MWPTGVLVWFLTLAAPGPTIEDLAVERAGAGARISFRLDRPADVKVAILDARNRVVRHLAAGLLGGPDGLLYAQLGPGYSGPLGRWTRDIEPAPYQALGSHILSRYIYGRYGAGFCEKGIAVARDGKVYILWMYQWAKYFVTGFGPDGSPIKGRYLEGQINPDHYKRGTPKALTSGIIGPVPAANGGLRVDSRGNIYVGVGVHTQDREVPPVFAKDVAFNRLVGSVVKFPPEGGEWVKLAKGKPRPPGRGVMMRGGNYFAGALAAYFGYAPLSGDHPDAGSFGRQGYCVCRVARFDLDRYDRLYLPNAVTNSVRVFDNAGNLLLEFGGYGNFDSAGPQSPIPTPEIPLGWPVGVGVSEDHIYISDMLNRRIVRVEPTYEATRLAPTPQR